VTLRAARREREMQYALVSPVARDRAAAQLGRQATLWTSDHVLFGSAVEAVARRQDCDDVLFRTDAGFAVVHLVWSGHQEAPGFPRTELYESWSHFVERRMAKDAASY
jgi:hypothetical protein